MKISRKLKLKIGPDMMRSIKSIGPWRSKRATFLAHSAGSSPIIMRDPSSGATGSKLKTARVRGIISIDDEIIATDEEMCRVGTVGTLSLKPGAFNVIPGEVELSVDFRDID